MLSQKQEITLAKTLYLLNVNISQWQLIAISTIDPSGFCCQRKYAHARPGPLYTFLAYCSIERQRDRVEKLDTKYVKFLYEE